MASTVIVGSQSYIRCSQQKLRDMAALVKGMTIAQMQAALAVTNAEAARRILETLNQTVANASHNFGISQDKLTVKRIMVHRGPHYKRFRPVSRGQGHAIIKRTSHIVIELQPMAVVEAKKPVEAAEPEVKTASVSEPAKKVSTKKKAVKKAE